MLKEAIAHVKILIQSCDAKIRMPNSSHQIKDEAEYERKVLKAIKGYLEKQVPQKPIIESVDRQHQEMLCPGCGVLLGMARRYIGRFAKSKKYCSSCGQALDWSA